MDSVLILYTCDHLANLNVQYHRIVEEVRLEYEKTDFLACFQHFLRKLNIFFSKIMLFHSSLPMVG